MENFTNMDSAILSSIGQPVVFTSGQFAGETIRTQLIEIQKANIGRKYARVDRRPLDPPPVVLLRLFKLDDVGMEYQSEHEIEDYREIQDVGIICHVDLFQFPEQNSINRYVDSEGTIIDMSSPESFSASSPYSSESQASFDLTFSANLSARATPTMTMSPIPSTSNLDNPTFGSGVESNMDSDANSQCTSALAGTTFVQATGVEYRGKNSMMFVFGDLAVKLEGTFFLRYRVFDISSKSLGSDDFVILAECYGGPFRVYSTKEFPGLQASTDLTKLLVRWGVRLNTRETERKNPDKMNTGGSGKRNISTTEVNNAESHLEDRVAIRWIGG